MIKVGSECSWKEKMPNIRQLVHPSKQSICFLCIIYICQTITGKGMVTVQWVDWPAIRIEETIARTIRSWRFNTHWHRNSLMQEKDKRMNNLLLCSYSSRLKQKSQITLQSEWCFLIITGLHVYKLVTIPNEVKFYFFQHSFVLKWIKNLQNYTTIFIYW